MSTKKHNCPALKFFQGLINKPSSAASKKEEEQTVSAEVSAEPTPVDQEHSGIHDDNNDQVETQVEVQVEAAQAGDRINSALQEFQNDTVAFMNKLPTKYDAQGEQVGSDATIFDQKAIEEKEFVSARDDKRKELTDLDTIAAGREAFAENDQADGFVDTFRYSGLQGMEENGLMRAQLEEPPWSDDYWAIYLGGLGKRYADPDFPASSDWKFNFDYIQNNPALHILENGDADAVNRLSPSEKYDILIGDTNMTLTKKMWDEGKKYYSRNGSVETWMGLCHGWAPVAYMLPRPTGTATVLAADGRTFITFYPSDIKALATLLWAKVKTESNFIGGRCNEKDPAMDPQTGRILSKKCFDTNPGTWHLAVVNQIGASLRSMVLDATYDYEVWNQPIVSYKYKYFNPQKMYYARSLAEASALKSSFENDRFKRYRDTETDSIVGIAMDVSYTVETLPRQNATDSADNDRVQTVRYYYDLELDFAGNIIGGEWYQNAHPDFLWTPVKGGRALTYWEAKYGLAGTWNSEEPIDEQWRQVAATTSGYMTAPLTAIVERLIEFSNT